MCGCGFAGQPPLWFRRVSVRETTLTDGDARRFAEQSARQQRFRDEVGREEAIRRFHAHLDLSPRGEETIPLADAVGRVLAADVVAAVDVPAFDRAGVDGFAVRAADTVGARGDAPVRLTLNAGVLAAGMVPAGAVAPGTATAIVTGGMVPRGADAVIVMDQAMMAGGPDPVVEIRAPAVPGQRIAAAGSDIGRGETVLRRGQVLVARDIGILAAIGRADVAVIRRPRVAVLSTGNEIQAPGTPPRPGAVYDSNSAILAAAVAELGAEPVRLGIAADDDAALSAAVAAGLECDALLLSGGTSGGAGDLVHRVVCRLADPGVVVHGVALKPGRLLCLAAHHGKPVVLLPGFPTSAMFTFHEFVAPIIRALAGMPAAAVTAVEATLPLRLTSEPGRTEYVMVSLVEGAKGLAAYPIAKESGAVTAFGYADGFLTIDAAADAAEANSTHAVRLIGRGIHPADLIIIGSHCTGLDAIVGLLVAGGLTVKTLNVGSMGGMAAARRGECDVAPVHLMDYVTGEYNRPFLAPGMTLVPGYRRMQGVVFRPGDPRFDGREGGSAAVAAAGDPACIMINRNAGSGTRILTDRVLGAARPEGYWTQAKTHNAVAVAVAQGRADWGVAIEPVAQLYGLGFLPLQEEHHDFVVPAARLDRPAVRRFITTLDAPATVARLSALGFVR